MAVSVFRQLIKTMHKFIKLEQCIERFLFEWEAIQQRRSRTLAVPYLPWVLEALARVLLLRGICCRLQPRLPSEREDLWWHPGYTVYILL